jgi:predicted NAD-dependent protein-ADP-ribosyltransferase YbiA (DUF1768 family)
MLELVRLKFEFPQLQEQLLATGDATLVEGNYWHDNYWGSCHCDRKEACKYHGQNQLGKLIMEVRTTIK